MAGCQLTDNLSIINLTHLLIFCWLLLVVAEYQVVLLMENSCSVVLEGVEYKQGIHYSDLVQNFLLHNSYMVVLGAVS